MYLTAYIIFILTLIYSVYTDIKDREISLYTLLLLVATGVCINIEYYNVKDVGIQWLLNAIFVGIQYGCLMLYLELRYKEGRQIFSKWIGLGDLLFFIAIGTHYMLNEFVLVYIGSLLFSALMFISFKSKLKTIPLAGFSALFILMFEIYKRY